MCCSSNRLNSSINRKSNDLNSDFFFTMIRILVQNLVCLGPIPSGNTWGKGEVGIELGWVLAFTQCCQQLCIHGKGSRAPWENIEFGACSHSL